MKDMDFEYIGWVPCVSGRLFFEYSSCGLGNFAELDINHIEQGEQTGQHTRYISITSIVDWKDYDQKNTNGKYRVFMVAKKTSEEISLGGDIFLLPVENAKEKFESIRPLIIEMNKLVESQEEIKSVYDRLVAFLRNQDNSFYRVAFNLSSPGFAKLKCIQNKNQNFSSQDKFTITRQAYYYLKYSFHKHRHHHDKAESLTTIHNLNHDKSQLGIKMLNDLRKSLVQVKRDSEPFNCDNVYRSKGIAAYAKSLATSAYTNDYLNNEDYQSEKWLRKSEQPVKWIFCSRKALYAP